MDLINKFGKRIKRMEHKFLKNVYLGRAKFFGVTCKTSVPPEHLELTERMLNQDFLRNYGDYKRRVLNSLLFGMENPPEELLKQYGEIFKKCP